MTDQNHSLQETSFKPRTRKAPTSQVVEGQSYNWGKAFSKEQMLMWGKWLLYCGNGPDHGLNDSLFEKG